MSEPDELKGIDLSAWDVPEPPDDLADTVVARLGGTDITPAVPVEGPKKINRMLLIGGVAAGVITMTLGVWMLVSSTRRSAPTNGVVVAQFVQQLSLDGVTADLDVGADVRWTRDGRAMHVLQHTGSAAWRIGADQRLVINAGASTVEANGTSSLRVEVKMNKVERVVGASAFAAAAVATVSVIVYDGKVTVETPNHERVVVAPGTTYTVEPPVEENVGVAPKDVTTCNLDTCILDNWSGPCCAKYKPTPTLTSEQITETMDALRGQIDACGQSYPATGTVDVRVEVRDDGTVSKVLVASTPDVSLGECVSQVISGAHFHPSQQAMTVFKFPLVFPSPKSPSPSCDATAERDQGDDAMAQGKHAEALAHYEAALTCKSDPLYVRLAFVAACNAQNQAKAKRYFGKLTQTEREKYRVVCIRNSIDVDDPKAVCDADKLKEEAIDLMGQGLHAGALSKLEAAIACRESPQLEALAYSSACNAKNADRAKAHYAKLSVAEQERLQQICVRNNIIVDTCNAAALKAKGVENADMGQHAAALAQFEASLRCKQDNDVVLLAGQAACKSNNAAKVKQYKATCNSCDADALKDKGMEEINMGEHAKGLALFEQSLACKQDSFVVSLAFMAACNTQDAAKARVYYGKLSPTQQTKYRPMCDRNHVDLTTTTCDADALKDKGMESVNTGKHAAALAQFEASLHCKQDSYVVSLAFIAACNAQNAGKARQYYDQLSPPQQSKYKIMCIRNHIEVGSSCDADGLKDKGFENVTMGDHAAALELFEKSLACKQDAYVMQLAFTAACNSKNAAKARLYYGKLTPAQQSKAEATCEHNGITLAASCDADDLKDKGMEQINNGEHTKALGLFEQSLACKPDPYVVQLAFMESCNSKNATKAREYWAQLTKDQQTKYQVICDRNNVDVFDTKGDPKGYLQVFSKPVAKILIDGVDTGLSTPIKGKALALTPGKHKVTFVIGQDRFTYFVQTKAGQTDTMTKDLQ